MTGPISKKAVFALLNDNGTHRKQFSGHSGVQKNKRRPTFSVPFDCGLCELVLHGTGWRLKYNSNHKQHYCFLQNAEAVQVAEIWEASQGTRVFVRNCLTTTLALDCNFVDNTSGKKTKIGGKEEAAKHTQHQGAIELLARVSADTICDVIYLGEADFICAVPAMPEKEFDLPTRLANKVSKLTGIPDITPHFLLSGKEKSLKECTLEEKWDAWSSTGIKYGGPNLTGKKVILIDDKYQSGVTLQYFGMKLQELGCDEIHGLCIVKTLRDTDNSNVVES